MTITTLPTAPSRTRPTTFSTEMDAMLAALPGFVNDVNATEATWVLSNVTATSTTSLTIGAGSRTLTVGAGKAFVAGVYLFVINSAAPANYMYGTVTSYSGTTLVMNITSSSGSGTAATWAVHPAGVPGTSSLSGGTAGVLPWQSAASTTSFTAAGTGGDVLVSGGTTSPIWTSTPSCTTAAKGDYSNKMATTTFVKNGGHFYSAYNSYSSGAITMSSAHTGAAHLYSGTSSVVWVLPPVSTVPQGSSITAFHQGGPDADLTVQTSGTDGLTANGVGVTSAVLHSGDRVEFVSAGWGWAAVGPVRYATAWVPTLVAPNTTWQYSTLLPAGVYPREVRVQFKCLTTQYGYSVGDVIPAMYTTGTYAAPPMTSVRVDGILDILTPSDATAWCIPHKTTRAMSSLTPANWAYKITAEF